MSDKRRYEETHPWISFQVDLRRAPAELWMLLGDARAKCELVSGVVLPPAAAEELHVMYLAKGVLGTTAIEGNTLTEEQVRRVLQGELDLPESKAYLAREVENIANACNHVLEVVEQEKGQLTPELIQDLNAKILASLNLSEEVTPGAWRRHSVGVARYLGPPHEDCPYLVKRLCRWLSSDDFDIPGRRLEGSILKAVLAHLYLAWIHPFGDGNGRTARMVEHYLLQSAHIPSPAAHLLSNHYSLTKSEYLRQLHRASQSGGDVVPFLLYALRGLVDELGQQWANIRANQNWIAWRDFVNAQFNSSAAPALRRRNVLLDLSRTNEPTPIREIEDLSPRLARAYAGKTPRTLARDIEFLKTKKLVEVTDEGVRARTEILYAFLTDIQHWEV